MGVAYRGCGRGKVVGVAHRVCGRGKVVGVAYRGVVEER